MTTYVLVPGACHGGWCYAELTAELTARGHRVFPLTLTGLSERAHLLGTTTNLDTHLQDVTAVLEYEQLTDVVLVGHSYGGMVLSGVAQRVPERIASLVYLDAFVPADGDSCWSLTTDEQRAWYLSGSTGYSTPPLPFFDPRASAHPLASLLQPIRLRDEPSPHRRSYVWAAAWGEQSPFRPVHERLRNDPQWTVYAPDAQHNLMRDAPAELLKILLDAG